MAKLFKPCSICLRSWHRCGGHARTERDKPERQPMSSFGGRGKCVTGGGLSGKPKTRRKV